MTLTAVFDRDLQVQVLANNIVKGSHLQLLFLKVPVIDADLLASLPSKCWLICLMSAFHEAGCCNLSAMQGLFGSKLPAEHIKSSAHYSDH